MSQVLKDWHYGGWEDGFYNYAGSKNQIKKTEFSPPSQNAVPTGVGSVKKASGAARFGGQVNSGYAVLSGIQFTTATIDKLIVHSGTSTFYKSGTNWIALTGLTLSASTPAYFCQALDSVYCSQA